MSGTADPARFVQGGRVRWGAFGTFLAGSLVWLWSYGVVASLTWVYGGIADAIADATAWLRVAIALPFEGLAGVARAAWLAFLADVQGFGLFAFPITVAVSVLVGFLIMWGVGQYGGR